MFLEIKSAYLVLTVPFVIVWAALFVLGNPNSRSHQLKRSLIGMPMGPISELLYFSDYWRPQSILSFHAGPVPILLEDLIFAFAVIGIGSTVYEIVLRKSRIRESELSLSRKVVAYFAITLIYFALATGLNKLIAINSIFATAISLILLSIIALSLRTDLWPAAIFTAFFFSFQLILIYEIGFHLFSNSENILSAWWFLYGKDVGVRICHVPLTESIWAFTYGFACPIVYSAATSVKYKKVVQYY